MKISLFFLDNLRLLFSLREKVLNSFRKRLFPIKNLDQIPIREPTPQPEVAKEPATTEPTKATKAKTKRKISTLKLREKILNEIKNEEKK